jgi:hypothetical protein
MIKVAGNTEFRFTNLLSIRGLPSTPRDPFFNKLMIKMAATASNVVSVGFFACMKG